MRETQTEIHPTAIIEKGAELDAGVFVGAYAYVGKQVKAGKGTRIHHHATIEGDTQLGEANEIFPYAYIGAKTHDLKYEGGTPGLKIGDRNTFREYVTVHLATFENTYTVMGSDNVMLAYSHVAHECVVGNHLVMSSHSALAGHVVVEDHVNVGWNVGVHQFCKVGAYAMLGACSKVVQDVLPYMIVDGNPAETRTINKVGMERNGFSKEDIQLARFAYKTMYRDGLNRSQAMELLLAHPEKDSRIISEIIKFVEASERGLA
jgi:UDP-N-acetylglucosamine acyltransferase